jgi:hypothetical protein
VDVCFFGLLLRIGIYCLHRACSTIMMPMFLPWLLRIKHAYRPMLTGCVEPRATRTSRPFLHIAAARRLSRQASARAHSSQELSTSELSAERRVVLQTPNTMVGVHRLDKGHYPAAMSEILGRCTMVYHRATELLFRGFGKATVSVYIAIMLFFVLGYAACRSTHMR